MNFIRREFIKYISVGLSLSVGGFGAFASDGDILVGVHAPIQTATGKSIPNGAALAIEEINEAGGVLGRKLKMVVADETYDPETGVNAIKKLIDQEKVNFLVGGYNSGVTLAQMPHVAKAGVIDLIAGSSSVQITQKVGEDYDKYKYYFRVGVLHAGHLGSGIVDFMTNFLNKKLGYKKFAIVGEAAKWVQDMIPTIQKGAEDAGLEVVLTETFGLNTKNFLPLLSKVERSGADYMVVILAHGPSDVLAKQWFDSKTKVPYGGIDVKAQDSDYFDRVGGKAISETKFEYMVRAPLSPKTIPFYDKFTEKYGTSPVYTGSGAYDSIYAYAEAAERAQSLDAEDVIDELEKTSMVSLYGRLEFDDNHDLKSGEGLSNPLWAQWQEGGEEVVIYPESLSNGEYILPPWLEE